MGAVTSVASSDRSSDNNSRGKASRSLTRRAIRQLALIKNGQGKRVGQLALGLIEGHACSAPYEDVTIKQG